MSITLSALQKQRRDSAANWTAENPTLLAGEIGIESDTGKIKIGNGSTAWISLGYQGIIPSSGAYPLNQLLMPSGTVSAPSISFDGDTNLGIYRSGTDQLSFTTAGTERLRIDAAGQIEAVSLGTAAAPTFSFTGDPNTGIYSPGADQVAISTGGSGRLFVDASGNVGVGANPSQRFSVFSGSAAGINNVAIFKGGGSSSGNGAGIILSPDSANTYATWYGSRIATSFGGASWGCDLVFSTNNNTADSNLTERLRITSAGLVGVGTSSPTGLLTVAASTPVIDWTLASNTAFKHSIESTGYSSGAASGNNLAIKVANGSGTQATVMHLNGAGQVGIGTTSPTQLLHVNGASLLNGLRIDGTDTVNTIYQNGAIGISSGNHIAFSTNAAGPYERARIDSSGRLLVGTSSTSANTRIVAVGNSFGGNGRIDIDCSTATPASGDGLGYLVFGDNTQSNGAWVGAERDGGTWSGSSKPSRLVFSVTRDGQASPTEAARINSTGKLNLFTASNDNVLGIHAAAAAGTSLYAFYASYGATSTVNPGTQSFAVFTNGNVVNTNNSYGSISDIKLKENIVDATSQWSDIKALQVRNYNFKEGQTHTQIGLIAQEVELVSPGLVSESPDRDADGNDLGTVTKSVNYSVLYMKAVKALQEAMERIEVLEQRLTDAGIA